MTKKYDLSVQNQLVETRRKLISTNGTEYDVSFVPAIVNRKYYKTYQEYQLELISLMPNFFLCRKKLAEGKTLTVEETKLIKDFNETAKQSSEASIELLVYVLRTNGYTEITEDEIFENFSEADIGKSINFIMGISDLEETEVKKK